VGVHQDSVFIGIASCGGVLAEQGDLPDQLTSLGTLSAAALLVLLVVNLDSVLDCTLNLDD